MRISRVLLLSIGELKIWIFVCFELIFSRGYLNLFGGPLNWIGYGIWVLVFHLLIEELYPVVEIDLGISHLCYGYL